MMTKEKGSIRLVRLSEEHIITFKEENSLIICRQKEKIEDIFPSVFCKLYDYQLVFSNKNRIFAL